MACNHSASMQKFFLVWSLLLSFLLVSCQRDTYVFGVIDQEVRSDVINKDLFRADINLVSTCYADLIGKSMSGPELAQVENVLSATNDRQMLVDMMMRSLLNREETDIPTNDKMRSDLPKFVNETYQRFYHRQPNPFEAWKLQDMIENNTYLRPVEIYYAFLSSDEYKRF